MDFHLDIIELKEFCIEYIVGYEGYIYIMARFLWINKFLIKYKIYLILQLYRLLGNPILYIIYRNSYFRFLIRMVVIIDIIMNGYSGAFKKILISDL